MTFLQKMMLPALLSIGLALIAPSIVYADNSKVKSRPKTALVLSGGGARGAAHVGVIRVLEELNIPIDYVVGTSMGSIVGGLYSAGYSPDELEHLLKTINWDVALQDTPPNEVLSYQRKQADKDLLGIEVGFNKGDFTIPEGLIAGQALGFILTNATQRVSKVTSFDRLPIPFRAVATDLGSGKLVALSQGDLATAMRASMSVPSVFVPVTIDGRKLIDGGLVRNLPVQVARDMGAERVIAVDIGSGFIDESELGDVLGVTVQVLNVLLQQNVDNSIEALKSTDFYLRPDLGDFSSSNFEEAYTVIKNGYQAAQAKRRSLARFATSPQAYKVWQKAQRRAKQKIAPTIDFIEVKGNGRVDKQQVLARVKQKVGAPLETDTLGKDLGRIYSIGDFASVGYNLNHQKNGRTGLEIDAKEKPWGPHYIRGAIQLRDDFEGGSSYNLLLNHRWTQLNRLGGEWENTIEIGQQRRLITEFHQPLTYDGRLFVAPRFESSAVTLDAYNGDNRVAEYAVDQKGVKFDFGWTPHNDTEVRLGLEFSKVEGNVRVGDTTTLPSVKADVGAVNFSVGLDRQDNPYFPTEGVQADFNLRFSLGALGSDFKYNLASFRAAKVWNRDKHIFGVNVAAASSFDSELPIYENFSLGGFGRLSGLNTGQLSGPHLGLAAAFYYRSLGESIPGNVGFTLEAGNVWQTSDEVGFDNLVYSGSVFWSYDSPIGAVYLGYGVTDGGEDAFHLTLGRPF